MNFVCTSHVGTKLMQNREQFGSFAGYRWFLFFEAVWASHSNTM